MELDRKIADLFTECSNYPLFQEAVNKATDEQLEDFNTALRVAAVNDKDFFVVLKMLGHQVGGLLNVMILDEEMRISMKKPTFRLGDGLFQAIYYKGDAYCTDCFPKDVDLTEAINEKEAQPVAMNDVLYYVPKCSECGYEHNYMFIEED
jgi:hypothetical protein